MVTLTTSNTHNIAPLCEMKGIAKKFPGVLALDNVSISVLPGEVCALLGENGSGKSTLIKVLCGLYTADEGEIYFNGKQVNVKDPGQAQKLGITTIHQEINLIPNMDIASNMFLNCEPMKNRLIIDHKTMYRKAQEVLNSLEIELDPKTKVSGLSVAEKQLVVISKAMVNEMRVLVLDEPTAALPASEVERLFRIIGRLKEQGVGIIYVSHRLEEIERLADRVTILRDGQLITTRDKKDLTIDDIIRLMVGRDVHKMSRAEIENRFRETVYGVTNLSYRRVFHDITLELKKGETLGIAGLVGSGRTELAMALGGALPNAKGQFFFNGMEANVSSPTAALKLGIGLLPSERKAEGLSTILSVKDNILMASLKLVNRLGFLFGKNIDRLVKNYINKLAIKISSVHQTAGTLSGGNQQKVVLAKVLARGSKVLVFDEPTRGIDVGTRREIYTLINQLTDEGSSIILSSSDLPELMETCDRILVMYNGRFVAEFNVSDVTNEELLRAVLGQGETGANNIHAEEAKQFTEAPPKLVESDVLSVAKKRINLSFSQAVGVPLLIVLLIIFFTISNPKFLSYYNIYSLSIQLSILLFLAIAETFTIITRGVDMSVGATIALVSMVVGVIGINYNIYLGLFAGITAAFLLGLFNSFFVGGMKMDPFIVTLGCMYVGRGFALLANDGHTLSGFPQWFSFIADGKIGPVPFLVILAVIFAVICQVIITKTKLGCQLTAIGGNSDGARVTGIKVGLQKGKGYIISALLAGVAGIALTSRLFSSQPTLGSGAHLEAITAAIIGGISLAGGRGDIIGAMTGVLVVGILANGMNIIRVSAYTQLVVMGAVLILSLIIDSMKTAAQEKRNNL